MPLTLALRDGAGAAVAPLRLDGRGAVIGRSPDADWSLPDPRSLVSSRHCQIAHRDGVYMLVDTSTNGTFVNGRRLAGPHRLASGDTIGIGDFQVAVLLTPPTPGAAPLVGGPQRLAQGMRPAGPTALNPEGARRAGPVPEGGLAALLHGAGIDRAKVRADEAQSLVAAGALLRRFVTAFRAMDQDRVKARGEIGAPAVAASAGVPNPIVAAQSAEQALALLLAPPQAGVVAGGQAVDDIAAALETHRRAVLQAMQAALAQTLDRVSPAAIRARAGAGAKEAALWRAYEAEAATKDGDFVELFAGEFRRAYEELARPAKA